MPPCLTMPVNGLQSLNALNRNRLASVFAKGGQIANDADIHMGSCSRFCD